MSAKARSKKPRVQAPTLLESMRKSRGLSLQEVGDTVGTHPTNLLKIEKGTHQPKHELGLALFKFYNGVIPIEEIYYPNPDERPSTCPCCSQPWKAGK